MKNVYRPSGKNYLYVNENKILKVDKDYISYLKSLAQKDIEGKCTMCLHNDIRAHLHEMINIYPKDTYVRPHSHPFKSETKIIIEGKLLSIVFNDDGEILDKFIMEKDGIFVFRMEKGIIHTNIPLTNVVFHEVIEGPFIGKDDSIFPMWAPVQENTDEVKDYMKKLKSEFM